MSLGWASAPQLDSLGPEGALLTLAGPWVSWPNLDFQSEVFCLKDFNIQ